MKLLKNRTVPELAQGIQEIQAQLDASIDDYVRRRREGKAHAAELIFRKEQRALYSRLRRYREELWRRGLIQIRRKKR